MSIIGLKLKKELEGDSVLPIENIVSAKNQFQLLEVLKYNN